MALLALLPVCVYSFPMPVYRDTNQLYACVRAVFDQIDSDHPGAAEAIVKAGINFRFRTVAPAGLFVIEGRRRPPVTHFGASPTRVDLDIKLESDTLHEILLGNLGVAKALGQKRLAIAGPALKALALKDLFFYSQSIYPAILLSQGVQG